MTENNITNPGSSQPHQLDPDLERLQKAVRGHERWLLIKWLHEKEVVRASMLGPDWVVVYTINGAIDVRLSELAGEE